MACSATISANVHAPKTSADIGRVRAHLYALADDSMQGRRTATAGGRQAARYIADQLGAIGVTPVGDSGFFQRLPLGLSRRLHDQGEPYLLADWQAYDSLPKTARAVDFNVVAVLRGADPVTRDSAVILAAHYDHHGYTRPVFGDSVLNGADDNASGVAALLEVARLLAAGPSLRRSLVLLFTTGEELGMLGAQWYIRHPIIPLHRSVANLGIEMIGQPDSLAGGFGQVWLTGDERSTMGSLFREAGLSVVADPRPRQRFFERSDNILFALEGVPAHTLSSFPLHRDYHRVTDEADRIDLQHVTVVTTLIANAARILANGAPPRWNPGGRPRKQ